MSLNENLNQSLKSYSKEQAQHMPGLTLANKFLNRFMKYKYHLPHKLTTNNTIKTHSLPMFWWHRYGSSGSYDSKFNGYVLEAWVNRYSAIRGYQIEVLLKYIPEYYHEILRNYLISLDDIYYYVIDNDVQYTDNKLCYDLIHALINRFHWYKNLCSQMKSIIIKTTPKNKIKKKVLNHQGLHNQYHSYHQVQRIYEAYVPRYDSRTNQKKYYPLYLTYQQIYYPHF